MDDINITFHKYKTWSHKTYEIKYKDYEIYVSDAISKYKNEPNYVYVYIKPCNIELFNDLKRFFMSDLHGIQYEEIYKTNLFDVPQLKAFGTKLIKSRNVYYQYNLEPEEKITSLIGSIKHILDKSI